MTNTSKGTALITGASTGIGAIYARRLAERGYDLILVARDAGKLNVLAAEVVKATGKHVEVQAADLTDAVALSKVEDVLRSNARITLLLNNAGVGATAPLLASDISAMEQMIRLNVLAPTRLAYAAAPGFVQRGGGTIINIASIAALAPELLNGVYGGSKAFVLALSQSLHHELSGKGIRVQVILPGAISTAFWDVAGMPVEHLPAGIVMSAQDMVAAALAGLDAGEFVTIPSLPAVADWDAFEAARAALGPGLSREVPALRYGLV